MSTRTSKADCNLYSVSNQIVQLYAGTDRAVNQSQLPPGSIVDNKVLDDTSYNWDTFLKVCDNTQGIAFSHLKANQGQENVIDCNNRVLNCSFEGEFGVAGQSGDQVITVKGGCSKLTFVGTIFSKGNNATIVVGAWSDQSHDISTDLDFSGLKRADGQPITFILARSSNVKLPPGAQVLRIKSLGYSLYWYAKLALVKLHIL